MTDHSDFVQALLVADLVLANRQGALRGSLLGIEVVSDERMPRNIYALGQREGAIVVRDAADFVAAFRKVVP